MPMFEYTARNPSGEIQKGQIDVQTKDEVGAYLRKNRLILVSVREAPKQINFSFGGAKRIKTRDIVIFTRQFATMINAGLPLVQSLKILAQQTENKALRDVTRAVVYDVESGNTLADAFSKHPRRSPTSTSTWWPRARRAVSSTRSSSGSPPSSRRTTRWSAR